MGGLPDVVEKTKVLDLGMEGHTVGRLFILDLATVSAMDVEVPNPALRSSRSFAATTRGTLCPVVFV
jgi:hypothetical protein